MAKEKRAPVKEGRKKKDPNGPKRASAAYMFFVKEVREKTKLQNPDASFGELGRILGSTWRELSDVEKKPYAQKAEADKKRYADEMAVFGK